MPLLLLTLLMAQGKVPDAPEWKEFQPKDATFSIRFPGTPAERANRTGTTWIVSAKDKVHSVAKNPVQGGGTPSQRDIQSMLNAVRDNIIQRVEAKLLSERTLEHQRIPAREYLFALPEEKGHLRVRCFVAKNHIWEIKIGGPKDYVAGMDADRFLDGLKIK